LHVLDLGDLREERHHRVAHARIRDAPIGLEDDVADLAGALAAEVTVQDVDALLALHVRQREVRSVTRTDGTHHDADQHDPDDPGDDDPSAAVVAGSGEALQHDRSFRATSDAGAWSPRPSIVKEAFEA
jgi:hypothetical protein